MEMRNIDKSFFGNKVLDRANFELKKGEVHALIGGNGAGKSTLMNIAAGLLKADSGDIFLNGRNVSIHSFREAWSHGISIIHQHPYLFPELSVADNIFIGNEPRFLRIFVNNLKMKESLTDSCEC